MSIRAQFIKNSSNLEAQFYGPGHEDVIRNFADQNDDLVAAIDRVAGNRKAFVKDLVQEMPEGPYGAETRLSKACQHFIKWFQVLVQQFYRTVKHPAYQRTLEGRELRVRDMIVNSFDFLKQLIAGYSIFFKEERRIRASIAAKLDEKFSYSESDEGESHDYIVSYSKAASELGKSHPRAKLTR
ncbi:MAG: hypothetical protein OXU45_05085 [Candidatus Melainabacteria bacterium]|nr:hypothetical protein [Candidatus Melainabacteria bacterium]